MTFTIALIALALGYFVFLTASKEKKGLKSLGQIIGAVIMICAFAGMVYGASKCRGVIGKPIMCPFTVSK